MLRYLNSRISRSSGLNLFNSVRSSFSAHYYTGNNKYGLRPRNISDIKQLC